MSLETHGRWPLVAAASVIPTTAAAVERPVLRPLAALFWHQTEEWVWPGSFLPWMNREVLGSQEDEFPIDRRLGFIINVLYGWGASVMTGLGPRAAGPAAALYVSHLANMEMHVSRALRDRRYNPGTITSLVTLTPVAVIGLRALATDPEASGSAIRAGAAGGLVASVVLPLVLKSRVRRRRAPQPD